MEFYDVARKRRSVRRFTAKKVPVEIIKKIVEDATYAPTNCNQQLWKIIAVTDNKIKERLVTEAYSSTIVRRAPVVLVLAYDGWNYKEAIQGCSFAGQNILLSATNHGIGALSMNSYGNDEVIKKILGIQKEYVINCFILLGYPEAVYQTTPAVKRRPVDEVLSFNKCVMHHNISRSYDPEKWTKDDLIDFQKYWCRKTFLGKRMDIMDDLERDIAHNALAEARNKTVIDFFSYDGGMLDLFPNTNILSINLEEETELYTKATVDMYCQGKQKFISYALFNKFKKHDAYDLATVLFKIERLTSPMRKELYVKAYASLKDDGELLIVTRLSSVAFNAYYHTIIALFGDDVRNTGIYAFWGPYKPLRKRKLERELKQNKFEIVGSEKYFLIPPFFNQALQMYIQYKRSAGTSYLHRIKHTTFLTKLFELLIAHQPKKNMFGSVLVLKARKAKKR